MSNAEALHGVSENGNGISTHAQVRRVIICAGTGCMANGAMKVYEEFKTQIAGAGLDSYHDIIVEFLVVAEESAAAETAMGSVA